jgi:hypothetical protein
MAELARRETCAACLTARARYGDRGDEGLPPTAADERWFWNAGLIGF